MIGILRARKVEPLPERSGGCGNHGFYARAILVDDTSEAWNHESWLRAGYQAWSSPKNSAFCVIEGIARGHHKTIQGGGCDHDALLVTKEQWVHLTKEKRYCIHRETGRNEAMLISEYLALPGTVTAKANYHARAGHRAPTK